MGIARMARIVNPDSFGPLSQKRLYAFERKAQIRLPPDYCEFLLEHNGGQPAPSFFWIKPDEDGSGVYQFYGLYDDPVHLSIETYTGEERYRIPISLLPIGDDGMGNYICLGISSSNFGEVFFLDHDLHPYDEPDSLEGIKKVANSFTEFLLSLRESPQ
jgi:hypothetical protein